jgi:hypothetical protein
MIISAQVKSVHPCCALDSPGPGGLGLWTGSDRLDKKTLATDLQLGAFTDSIIVVQLVRSVFTPQGKKRDGLTEIKWINSEPSPLDPPRLASNLALGLSAWVLSASCLLVSARG